VIYIACGYYVVSLGLVDRGDGRGTHAYYWTLDVAIIGISGEQAYYESGPYTNCKDGFVNGKMTMTKIWGDMGIDYCEPNWPETLDVYS
jgi:hypothetical protein